MRKTEFQLRGFEELKAVLRSLPQDLTHEGQELVNRHARQAAQRIHAAYPVGPTGNLRAGVGVEYGWSGRLIAASRVVSAAPHVHIFEKGTKPRRTRAGATRGRMRPANVFKPIAREERTAMWAALRQMVQAHGLLVSG